MTVAAYDHPDSTNYLKKNNFERRNWECGLCEEYEQAFDHLISGCPHFCQKNKCIIKHDKIDTRPYYSVLKKSGIETMENWCSHITNSLWTWRCSSTAESKDTQHRERFWKISLTLLKTRKLRFTYW
jgi:hypothetical protein